MGRLRIVYIPGMSWGISQYDIYFYELDDSLDEITDNTSKCSAYLKARTRKFYKASRVPGKFKVCRALARNQDFNHFRGRE